MSDAANPNVQPDPGLETILDAVERLGDSVGTDGLTMRRIAAEAGITTSGLYSQFGSKRSLVEALSSRTQSQLEQVLDDGAASAVTSHDRLQRLCFAYVEFALTNPWRYALAFDDDRACLQNGGSHPSAKTFVDRAAACIDDEPQTNARALWVGLHGLVTALIHDGLLPRPEELDGPERRFVGFYLLVLLRGAGVACEGGAVLPTPRN